MDFFSQKLYESNVWKRDLMERLARFCLEQALPWILWIFLYFFFGMYVESNDGSTSLIAELY